MIFLPLTKTETAEDISLVASSLLDPTIPAGYAGRWEASHIDRPVDRGGVRVGGGMGMVGQKAEQGNYRILTRQITTIISSKKTFASSKENT